MNPSTPTERLLLVLVEVSRKQYELLERLVGDIERLVATHKSSLPSTKE